MGSSSGYRRRPRRGTLQYWPRVKAKRMVPKIRSWTFKGSEPALMGFCGYKAGMTHIIGIDNAPNSHTKGDRVRVPVTIVEIPDIRVLGLRLYVSSPSSYGSRVLSEIWADNISTDLSRKLKIPKKRSDPKKMEKLQADLERTTEIRVLVYTQPKSTAFGKKRPDILEMAVGGSDIAANFEFAKGILGKEITMTEVFKEGALLDVHAVTTGKGFQGSVKRFGVSILHRKSHTDARRKIGTLGNWTAKTWRVPHPGQMGFHNRTEYNKQVLKISTIEEQDVNPQGGLAKYGVLKGKYALFRGSLPGPKKRLIRFTHGSRDHRVNPIPEIVTISQSSQQR